jgi:hypothetical protein
MSGLVNSLAVVSSWQLVSKLPDAFCLSAGPLCAYSETYAQSE